MAMDEARLQNRAGWDRMAPAWGKYSDYVWSVSRRVGEWLVDRLDPKPGQTILEIAAGPGDTGFVAARLIGDGGRLISTDWSAAMVAAARTRAESLGITNAEFRAMDAENMDLEDDSVDGVLCRWGFMLMLDPATALRETRRVLRPGGRLACSVWARPEVNPWITVVGMVLTNRGTPPQADPFGPGGMFSLSDHDRIEKVMREAGYEEVEIEEMPLTWTFPDFDAYWTYQKEHSGAISALVADMAEDDADQLRGELESAVESYRSDDGYAFPGVTNNVLAH